MTKVTQREAVYQAVISVLTEARIHLEDGQKAKSVMTKEHRAQVNTILALGFTSGSIELKDTESNRTMLSDPSEMKEYVSQLQSTWLNEDTRLNGGVDHEIKIPGSGDRKLKVLRSLLAISTDQVDKVELKSHIRERIAEIKRENDIKNELKTTITTGYLVVNIVKDNSATGPGFHAILENGDIFVSGDLGSVLSSSMTRLAILGFDFVQCIKVDNQDFCIFLRPPSVSF